LLSRDNGLGKKGQGYVGMQGTGKYISAYKTWTWLGKVNINI
jgi:hypothetical protein